MSIVLNNGGQCTAAEGVHIYIYIHVRVCVWGRVSAYRFAGDLMLGFENRAKGTFAKFL